ncbi:hypothetical protein TNCV_4040861 [Trichonephila clavipes]|nr:hypothetical protein TNCV_4040861 [Trichonephila clavipes]
MLDCGSESTFISEKCLKLLGIKRKNARFQGFEFTPSRSEVVSLKLSGIGNPAFLLAAAFAYLFTGILAPDSVENRVSF